MKNANMKITKIRSKDAAYQKLEVLGTNRNKRYRYYEFLVEGVRNINEAIKNGWQISSLVYSPEMPLSDWAKNLIKNTRTEGNLELTLPLMTDLSGKEDTSELMAVVKMRPDEHTQIKPKGTPLIALFDRPSNKGNLGTMIRSCDALGADMLIITGHAVDLYEPDVVVSAMGSFFNMPVVRIADNSKLYEYIAKLKEQYPNFKIVGTTAHKESPIYAADLTGPVMLMMGNETMGLNKAFKENCDILCTIPMAENSYASSFNVSCAASIMMYEITRQRIYHNL